MHVHVENTWLIIKNNDIEKFTFWTWPTTFRIFGAGVPMFFHFMAFLMYLFLVMSVVGIPALVINILQDDAVESSSSSIFFMTYLSLGNHGDETTHDGETTAFKVVVGLNLLNILILVISYRVYRFHQISQVRQIDEKSITPSDFTVVAYNIAADTTSDELQTWLENEHDAKDIMKIIYCYDIVRIMDLFRKK
jgi:hypothetical protein